MGFEIGIEDLCQEPVPVDLTATPGDVTFFNGDILFNNPGRTFRG